ncbi:MAG TPA: flagellar basal-body MS-ring/collar protein FliF [Acidiphilium sp.]
MNRLLENLRALGPVKLGTMGGVAVAVLGLMTMLMLGGGPSPNATLYSGLGLKDAANIAAALKTAHIPYRIGEQGHSILVTRQNLDPARLLLARHDLPAGSSQGFAIFDHQNPLTGSEFLDRIDETRAIDGELERTIDLIQGIRASRVQVVLPRREDFSLRTEPARASVMLSLANGAPVDRESVDAILSLVASAVPGLKPGNISIADNRGELLAQAGRDSATLLNARDAAIKQAAERHISDAVRSMLDATIGSNQVRVVTSVSMDFDQTSQTSTSYDPNGQVVRSQQQNDSQSSRTTNRDDTVSISNNLPGATTDKPTPKRTETSTDTDETTNYEISQTVRHIVHATPQITRISVAVLLDGVEVPGKGGKPVWQPRSAAAIARIQKLVETAIGYDKTRGDVVTIQSMRFVNPDAGFSAPKPSLFARIADSGIIMPLLRILITGLVGFAAILFVFRPMIGRLTMTGGSESKTPDGGGTSTLETGSRDAIAGPDGEAGKNPIRMIADLVDRNPEATVAVIRDWLSHEGAR